MPNPPTPAPVERFASLIRWLTQAVITRTHLGLPQTLIGLIIGRLRGINQGVKRIADRILEGKYAPPRSTPRRRPAKPPPRPPDKLPRKFGWLLPLVPDALGSRSQLQYLLQDPAMVALIQAAPTSLGRQLRSLCWMLGLRPPDIAPLPAKPRPPRKRPRPPREPRPAKPEPLRPIGPPPPHPDAPWWLRMPPSRTRWLPSRARAPKNRA